MGEWLPQGAVLRQTRVMRERDLIVRVERGSARDQVDFARTIARQDPSWRTENFDLADGVVVLCGAGLFVNRALGVGLDAEVTETHLIRLEHRCRAVDVLPTVEVTDATRPSLEALLLDRNYTVAGQTSVLVRVLDADGVVDEPDSSVRIDAVDSGSLATWQDTAALAWGHSTPIARRASDAFARAADEVDEPGLLLVCSASDRRILGCATLKISDRLATLGAMSTLRSERSHGVQTAVIKHRLLVARSHGCDLAASSADVNSGSERNLLRTGFHRLYTKVTYQRLV